MKNRNIYGFHLFYVILIVILFSILNKDPIQSFFILYSNVNINESISIFDTCIVNKKNVIIWTKLNSSYYQMIPKTGSDIAELFVSGVAREYATFFHIKNIYCTPNRALATEYQNVIIYYYKTPPILNTSYYYENIIYLYSEWGNIFAHFIHDSLAELMAFPKELIEKSKIMISFNISIAMQYFKIFNIEKDQILYNENYWYYTSNLYLYLSKEPHNGYNMYSYQKIVKKLRKYFEVNRIIAKRFVFINRLPHNSRYISNFKELFEETKKVIPSVKWEINLLNYSSLKTIATNIASIKLWVTPSGSNTIYMMFMNRNYTTGICLIQSIRIDLPNYISAISFQICAIGFTHNWDHHEQKPHLCNIPDGIYCIKSLYYLLINRKWPPRINTNFMEAFNFKDIYNITKENVSLLRHFVIKNGTMTYPIWIWY